MPCPATPWYCIVTYSIHTHHWTLYIRIIARRRMLTLLILTSVTPDLTIVPKNYHPFISPSLRRVYLDDAEAETSSKSRAAINNLKTEIATLKGRVASLKRHNDVSIGRYHAAENTVADLRLNELNLERNLRLALDEKQNPKRLRAEYDALKSLFFLLCEVVLEITWSVASRRR